MDRDGTPNLDGQPLLEAVLDEQSIRWGRGDRPRAEEYFERFPALRDDSEAALDVIFQEFLLRRELGEWPQPEEFIRRFPFLSKMLIIAQFAAAEVMRSADEDRADKPTGGDFGPREGKSGAAADVDAPGPDGGGSMPSFPGYEVIGVVGRGGMGVVYKARSIRLGRVVALKTVTELEPTNPNQFARFLDEARAAARLQHPNIITVYEIGEHDGRPFFAQEFIDGGDLKSMLANGPMAVRLAAERLETLARGVHAAHNAGIVHRDLKPSNILITTEGIPKVADFGLAKLLGGDSGRTQSGQVVGTPSYMAPEQAEGRSKDVEPAADVYALGAVLYEALTGRPPFLGESQLQTLKLLTSTDVVPPRLLRPDVPRDLETICLKCLERQPGKRYLTALELAEDLGRFHRGEPVRARRIGPLRRCSKWAARHPWQTTSAAILVAAVSAFMGFMYWHTIQLSAKEAKARHNYLEARATITAMLGRLDDRRLTGTPRLLEIRTAAREDALAFYERVLEEVEPRDPAIRADTVKALNEACILQVALGRNDKALKSIRRALLLVDSLRSERPDEQEFVKLRLDCLIKLGALLDMSKEPDDALAACRESVELATRLAEARPDDSARWEQLAMCHTNFGNKLIPLKNSSESMVHYQEATKIRKSLVRSNHPGATPRLADSLMNEGVILWGRNHLEAQERFREAADLMHTVPPDHREEGGNSVLTFGRIYVNWGGVLNDMKRYDDAISRLDEGLRIVEPYLRNEPKDSVARMASLSLHGNRAISFSGKGKHRESAQDWSRVVELSPEPVPDGHRIRLAMELLQAGELGRALAQAQLVRVTPEVGRDDCYNLGCLYALCAATVQKGASLSPAQQSRLVESHISDAIRWLRSAADTGMFSDPVMRDHAKNDPDLAILAGRAEFRRMVEPAQAER